MATEEKDVNGFFQRPQFDAFERLICGHLIEAARGGSPLESVIHITRASLTIKPEQAKIYDVDKKLALSLYTISQRIGTAIKNTDKWGEITYSVGLRTVDWDRDIAPWKKTECYGWLSEGDESEKITCALDEGDAQKAFMLSARRLSPSGFANMTSDFLFYAVPIVEDMSRKLSSLVSPETYTEMMKLYHGDKA